MILVILFFPTYVIIRAMERFSTNMRYTSWGFISNWNLFIFSSAFFFSYMPIFILFIYIYVYWDNVLVEDYVSSLIVISKHFKIGLLFCYCNHTIVWHDYQCCVTNYLSPSIHIILFYQNLLIFFLINYICKDIYKGVILH